MLENTENRVLLAYSKNFKENLLFKSKVEKLTKNLNDFDVVSIDDSNHFIEEFFKEKVVEKYKYASFRNGDLRKIVDSVKYAIIFWDGSDLIDLVYLSLKEKINTRIIPVETTRVVNKDKGEKFDIYIGRGTPWGNPYAIGNGLSREDVIEKYREYFYNTILTDDKKRKDLRSLKGKVLGCHCKPLACHGDIIAEYLNTLDEEPTF